MSEDTCVYCKAKYRDTLSDYDACVLWRIGCKFIDGYGPLCTACYHSLLGTKVREENHRIKAYLWWYNLLLGPHWFGKIVRRLLVPRFPMDEEIARAFHEAYERLAPEFGYKTRDESAKPWKDVPKNNKGLMIAVVRELRKTGLPWIVGEFCDLRKHARPWG